MQKDLTSGSVFKTLIKFSLPFLLSSFLQTLYGLADLFIVGQYNGADVISAVSVGSQIMHMLTVMIVGLAMGATVRIGKEVGAKDINGMNKTIGNIASLFIAVSVVLTFVLLAFTKQIVHIMSTPKEAVEQTILYIKVCFMGIPFITAYNIISSVLRGMGDSKSPMYFVAIACILNIVLDYLFVGAFSMRAEGAAIATVLAQTLSVVLALFYITKSRHGIKLRKADFAPEKSTIKDILKVGVPVCLQDGFIQISFILITIIANRRGVEIAAAVGIVEKIICFLFLVPSAMLSSVSALVAQNIGAKKEKRAKQTLYYALLISAVAGVLFTVICEIFAYPVLSLFTDEHAVAVFGIQYLKEYVFDCIAAGIHFCYSGYFCALGKSMVSFFHNVASILLVRVPGAYFAAIMFPDNLFPMGLAAPLGSLLSALICIGVYIYTNKNKASDIV